MREKEEGIEEVIERRDIKEKRFDFSNRVLERFLRKEIFYFFFQRDIFSLSRFEIVRDSVFTNRPKSARSM